MQPADELYSALALPPLLFQHSLHDDLKRLVDAPNESSDLGYLDRLRVSMCRHEYAMKASIRNRSFLDAAIIGMKAGTISKGIEELKDFFGQNADLIRVFFQKNQITDLIREKRINQKFLFSTSATTATLLFGSDENYDRGKIYLREA